MNQLRKFIDIVSETPEEVRSAIDKKIQKIPDENDLTDILKFTNRFSIKKDVETFATVKNYKGIVSDVLLQALANSGISDQAVKKFLKKLATDGILDEKQLLTPRVVHSYSNIIDSAYRAVFDSIKLDLFQKIAGKIGEIGDVGKGEYLLDIISPFVKRRGAPGDLDVSGVKVELKAGENGRVGPAGSMALVGRFQREFLPLIQKLVGEKASTISNPTDFNLKLNMTFFSEFFETEENVKIALAHVLGMHYPGYNVQPMVDAIVGSNGSIDGSKLKEQMLKASFESYRAAKEFDGIIIMDAAITKFLFVGSGEDLAAVSGQLIVKFPSWTDQQSDCVKVTLAKSGGKSVDTGSSSTTATTTGTKTLKDPKASMAADKITRPGRASRSTNQGLGRERR